MYSYDGSRVWDREVSGWVPNPLRAEWVDSVFYAGGQVVAGEWFESVMVRGVFGDAWFNGWGGVGPSRVPYSMKALRAGDGTIYRPGADRSGYMVVVQVPARAVSVVNGK